MLSPVFRIVAAPALVLAALIFCPAGALVAQPANDGADATWTAIARHAQAVKQATNARSNAEQRIADLQQRLADASADGQWGEVATISSELEQAEQQEANAIEQANESRRTLRGAVQAAESEGRNLDGAAWNRLDTAFTTGNMDQLRVAAGTLAAAARESARSQPAPVDEPVGSPTQPGHDRDGEITRLEREIEAASRAGEWDRVRDLAARLEQLRNQPDPPADNEAEIARLEAQLEEASRNGDWGTVRELAGQIEALRAARPATGANEAEIARLEAEIDAASRAGDWTRVRELADQLDALRSASGPSPDEQRRAAEIARLENELETARQAGEWSRVGELAERIDALRGGAPLDGSVGVPGSGEAGSDLQPGSDLLTPGPMPTEPREESPYHPRSWRPLTIGMGGQMNYLHDAPRLSGVATVAPGRVSASTQIEVMTQEAQATDGTGEFLRTDGAFFRLTQSATIGFAPGWDVTVRLPILAARSGNTAISTSAGGITNNETEPNIGPMALDLRWALARPESSHGFKGIVGVGSIRLPWTDSASRELISDGVWNLSAAVTVVFGGEDWRLHLGVGYTAPGPFGINEHTYDGTHNIENIWMLGTSFAWRVVEIDETKAFTLLAQYQLYGSALLNVVSPVGAALHDLSLGGRIQVDAVEFTLGLGLTAGTHGADFISTFTFTVYAF